MFHSTTIPILEQVVNFTEARHGVLAGNIANIDTPGYRTRDLSPELFEESLREAIEYRNSEHVFRSPGEVSVAHPRTLDNVSDSAKSILYHDDSNVSVEQQVTEVSKNQATHNLALTILISQLRQLESAISERVDT